MPPTQPVRLRWWSGQARRIRLVLSTLQYPGVSGIVARVVPGVAQSDPGIGHVSHNTPNPLLLLSCSARLSKKPRVHTQDARPDEAGGASECMGHAKQLASVVRGGALAASSVYVSAAQAMALPPVQ